MKKVLSLILVCVMVLSLGSAAFAASGKWVQYNGKYYYQKGDGSYCVSEWAQIDGKYYYFWSDGTAASGVQQINGSYYYIGMNGAETGWKLLGGQYYYFGPDGTLLNGIQNINGKWYCLVPYAHVGLMEINLDLYYFGPDGAMVFNSVQTINGKVYYFTGMGNAYKGWLQYNSNYYYFKDDGTMAANEVVLGYKFAANGICTGKAQAGDAPVVTAFVSTGTVLTNLYVTTETIPNGPAVTRVKGDWVNNTAIYYTGACIFSAYGMPNELIYEAATTYPAEWKQTHPAGYYKGGVTTIMEPETSIDLGFQIPDYETASTYYILAINTDADYNYVGYTIITIQK